MLEVELELAKLGIPIKTRHNEVAPNQFEVTPVFEKLERSDHQMVTMQIMQNTARRYGLVCLLHEKPSPASKARASTTTGRWAPTPA